MSFYSDASLVLVPSGVKDSKVYSIKPTDGSGDLTFTRNSNATRIGPDGKLEKVRQNLALYSQDFSNAAWTKGNCTVTGSQADPNGGTNAFLFTDDATNDLHYFYQFVTPQAGEFTFSFYAKANTLSHCGIRIYDGGIYDSAIFNLSNGTKGSGDGSIESVGNGWYRVSLTKSIGGSFAYFNLFLSNGSTYIYSGSGQSIYVFGAQYESGVMTDYIPTTSAAVSVGPTANVPRLDYSGGATCGRLILEPQRSNSAQFSESFSNSYWSKYNTTITSNATTSPDGYANADKFAENTATNFHSIDGSFSSGTGVFTASLYAKQAGRRYLRVLITEITPPVNHSALFDLQTGTVVNNTAGVIASVQSAANGFYRLIITSPALVGGQVRMTALLQATTSSTSESYTGDGTSGVFLWGAQLEAGSYPTSYIPTLGASVTRLADAAYKTGISSLIGQTEGTIFLEMTPIGNTTSYTERVLRITGGTDELGIQRYADSRIVAYGLAGGVSSFAFDITNIFSAGQVEKIAIGYKLNDVALYVNGVQLGTDTSAAMFTSLANMLFANDASAGLMSPQEVSQLLLFKTRLTNAQLAELTAL